MKFNKYISIISALLIAIALTGCTDAYDRYNKTGVDDNEGERDAYFLRQHLVNMQNWIITTTDHAHQFTEMLLGGSYSGYFADTSPGFTIRNFATYAPESGWTASTFNNTMSNPVGSYRTILAMTEDPVFISVAKIMKVMSLSKLTDIYGPIPYSDLEKDGQLNASYDPQDQVYEQMMADLNSAIDVLTLNQTMDFSSKADRIFSGKVVNWIKMANSVKLRLAIRMANVNPSFAKKCAEEAVNHEIGVMTSNSDNAELILISGQTNPYQVTMFDWNGGDSRIGADITSYMNGYNDPRMAAYFDFSKIKNNETKYVGIRNGIDIPSPQSDGQSYSNMNINIRTKKSMILMCAAEISFLRAEGALRGWNMGGSAKDLYETGITLSFAQWGVTSASYIADNTSKPQLYIDPLGKFSYSGTPSSITISWDNTASQETNLERIITQKWIALYPNGIEAWSEFRRTGYPKLMPVLLNRSTVVNSDRMARRLEFPQSEYTGNGQNVQKAVSYLGGPDNMATDLWWAKKN